MTDETIKKRAKDLARQLARPAGSIIPEDEAFVVEALRVFASEVRAEALEEAARAVEDEHLTDPQTEADGAYDLAIEHAASAIRALQSSAPTPARAGVARG